MNDRSDAGQSNIQAYLIPISEGGNAKIFDLGAFSRKCLKHWKSAFAVIVLTVVAGGILAVSVQPVFQSEVIVDVSDPGRDQGMMGALSGQLGGLAALAGVNLGGSNLSEKYVAMLTSRDFTIAFLMSEDLLKDLFSEDWDAATQSWSVDPPDVPSVLDAYERFDEDVREIRQDRRTGLVTMSIKWTDRELAAKWANKMVAAFNDYARDKDVAEATRSIQFLENQLSETGNVELKTGINRLIQTQIQTIMLASVRPDYAFQIVDPALIPDEDDYVWPNRIIVLLVSLVLGGLLASILVVFRVLRSD